MSYFDLIAHDIEPNLSQIHYGYDLASYAGSMVHPTPPGTPMDKIVRYQSRDVEVQLANAGFGSEDGESRSRYVSSNKVTDSNKSQAQILVVEDEGIVALDIRNTLNMLGYHVVGVADTAWDAIYQTSKTRPDLVLMDIRLSGEMDGIEAAAYIRQEFGISVVFLTAQADEATQGRADSISPAGYLIKPFSTQDLETMLAAALLSQGNDQSND